MITGNWPIIRRAVLIDYGLSCSEKNTEDTKSFKCDEYSVGPSQNYVPPEVFSERVKNNSKGGFLSKPSDVWSLAITFVAMTLEDNIRDWVFPSPHPDDEIDFINNDWKWNEEVTKYQDKDKKLKKEITKIVLKMIEKDPNNRLSAKDALQKFKTLERTRK